MPDEALTEAIEQVIKDSPFHGEGYRKVRARLRHKGIRTSPDRVLRVMRENGLLAKSCRGPARGPRAHDGTIIPLRVDEMWGTDMTTTALTTGKQVAVFVAIDHLSARCMGLHAAKRVTPIEVLEPIRHDNGSQYVNCAFRDEVRRLGIDSSPSFVRFPEGSGCAERFIRTHKEKSALVEAIFVHRGTAT